MSIISPIPQKYLLVFQIMCTIKKLEITLIFHVIDSITLKGFCMLQMNFHVIESSNLIPFLLMMEHFPLFYSYFFFLNHNFKLTQIISYY